VNINFVDWKSDKLIFDFTARPDVEPHLGNDAQDWQGELDLKTGIFSNPVKIPGPSRFAGQ
jgi:hypothetical protein